MSSAARKSDRLTPHWTVMLDEAVGDLSFSPDGKMLAVATLDGSVQVLSVRTGRRLLRAPGHEGGALCVAWSLDGRRLASGGEDGCIRLLDMPGGSVVAEHGGRGWVSTLTFAPVGSCLAVACGRTVRFFDEKGQLLGESLPHLSTVTALAFDAEGRRVWSTCYGGVYRLAPGWCEPELCFEWRGSLLCLALSPNGKYVAAGDQEALAHVWQAHSGRAFQLNGYDSKVCTLAFSPTGAMLATAGGADIVLYDMTGGSFARRPPRVLRGHRELITELTFLHHPGPELLVSGAKEGVLFLWEPGGQSSPRAWHESAAPVLRVAASPTGGFATGAQDGTLAFHSP